MVGGLWATLRAGLSPAHSDKPPRIPLCKLEEVPVDGIKEIAVSYEMQQFADSPQNMIVAPLKEHLFKFREEKKFNQVLLLVL